MRKMKKINGYLVVRFNDREKRLNEGTGLGSFGVIDAELYSGILDIDRDLMEFDGADTLEEAIEQARSLEAEQDVDEPQIKITIVKESDTDCSEEEVDPVAFFNAEKSTLKAINENCAIPSLGDLITTQRLYGYTRALTDLGIVEISDERFQVDPALPSDYLPTLLTHQEIKDFQQYQEILEDVKANSSRENAPPKDVRAQFITLSPAQKAYLENSIVKETVFKVYKAILEHTKGRMSEKQQIAFLESLQKEFLAANRTMARAHYEALSRIRDLLSLGVIP